MSLEGQGHGKCIYSSRNKGRALSHPSKGGQKHLDTNGWIHAATLGNCVAACPVVHMQGFSWGLYMQKKMRHFT